MTGYNIPPRCVKAMLIGAGLSISSMLGLTILLPFLGFGISGPIEASFAAWVQSIIGAEVSSGSIFALLQSIGMAGISFNTGVYVTGASATLAYTICKYLGYDDNNNC